MRETARNAVFTDRLRRAPMTPKLAQVRVREQRPPLVRPPRVDETWTRIGLYDKAERRSLWVKEPDDGRNRHDGPLWVRAGREGDDEFAIVDKASPIGAVLLTQLWAVEIDTPPR
jgi:hypothetical protein